MEEGIGAAEAPLAALVSAEQGGDAISDARVPLTTPDEKSSAATTPEKRLSLRELRELREQAESCFCGTDRHLPTNTLPFEGGWVQCDRCDRWCHGECAGLTLQEAEKVEAVHMPCVHCGVRRTSGECE